MNHPVSNPNPLFQPIQYNGEMYYTGQYFHHLYRQNAKDEGKYEQLGTFLRLVRSIETYANYIEAGDIVELNWQETKESSDANLASVFKSNSYRPIMLINATAQIALTHHLDDEVSKQASVNINQQTANQQTSKETLQKPSRRTNPGLDKLREAQALSLSEQTAARICERFSHLGGKAQQVIYAKIINPLLGYEVISLPPMEERHYSATEVGDRYGISAAMVGRIANQNGLKTAEYGMFFLDKSPHSAKQVESFRYNERGVEKIGELVPESAESN